MNVTAQKRALFFVFDGGTGIGHLRRLACIARRLQGRFSCLIVTGHRAAAHWFVPEECEYVRLPSWDGLLEPKARYWGRKPFIALDEPGAIRLRQHILTSVVEAFTPDVIFVDHLPLGAHEELAEIIERTSCLKYLVTRGVLNESGNMRELVLGGRAHRYLKDHYCKTLVAADSRVFDFTSQYDLAADLREKTVHTGYVIEPVSSQVIARTREHRGLGERDIWVVASAGGGQLGERLIEASLALASRYPHVTFDITLGPRSSLPWEDRHDTVITRGNLRLHREIPDMQYLNASADVVICSGGYNTLLETLQGNAKILCFPLWKDKRDEQYRHASRLQEFADLQVSMDLTELAPMFERALASLSISARADRRRELDFNGAAKIEQLVLEELGVTH